MSGLEQARELDPGSAGFVAILRRDEEILPAVARLSPERAAAELLVCVGAPLPPEAAPAANRLKGVLSASSTPAYLMNTGAIGGGEGGREIGVAIGKSIVAAIGAASIEWEPDPDFGYETAVAVPGIEDADYDLLCPRLLYGRTERPYEYAEIVERSRRETAELLGGLEGLEPEIAAAAPPPAKRGRQVAEDEDA